jgi:putative transposase
MARKPRLYYPGACYHVILRGNARQNVFYNDAERCRFCLLVQEAIERFGFHLHGFCLMTNHAHLAVEVGQVSLSRIMQNICCRYSRWINLQHKRIGHLFNGRFKAIMIDADSYLSQVVGYIHLNPVRAGMVESCEEYEWSSHRCYVGIETIPWLTTETVLSQFSGNVEKAHRLFHEFVCGKQEEGHRSELHGAGGLDPRIFGEDRFVDNMLCLAGKQPLKTIDVNDVLKAVVQLYEIEGDELIKRAQNRKISEARSMAAWGVIELSSSTLTELAGKINRDVSTLSAGARRMRTRALQNTELAMKMQEFKKVLAQVAMMQS